MGGVAAVFSGAVLVGAAGLGLWLLTHPPRRRAAPGAGRVAVRAERWRVRRRVVMVAGLVLVAAAFFVGVNFLPAERTSRSGAVLFVAYWGAVLVLAMGLLVLALVDMALLRRRRSRRDTESFVGQRAPRRRSRDREAPDDGASS
jgi:cytochrome c biogenesis protein CcdA